MSDKLGTCDERGYPHSWIRTVEPRNHAKRKNCVNWREQPAQGEPPQDARDGFGSIWPPCDKHNRTMTIVRPGHAVCDECQTDEYIARLNREVGELREERDALKRESKREVEFLERECGVPDIPALLARAERAESALAEARATIQENERLTTEDSDFARGYKYACKVSADLLKAKP